MNPILPSIREILRRAILTLAAMPGKVGPSDPINPIGRMLVRVFEESYGYSGPAMSRFTPTPRDVSINLEVLGWLSWYAHNVSIKHYRVFVAWALDTPMWKIQTKHKASKSTVHRWVNDVAEEVINNFPSETKRLAIDERDELVPYMDIHTQDGEMRAELIPRSPSFIREPDAVPIRGAFTVDGSPAQYDRGRLIKRLEKNARMNDRRKRKAELRKACVS